MLNNLRKLNEEGILFPLARDAVRKEPSVTLLFLYINNILAFVSLILLHFKSELLVATATTCTYSIIWVVLYMIRKIHSAKFDLDDKSVELEGEDDEVDSSN